MTKMYEKLTPVFKSEKEQEAFNKRWSKRQEKSIKKLEKDASKPRPPDVRLKQETGT